MSGFALTRSSAYLSALLILHVVTVGALGNTTPDRFVSIHSIAARAASNGVWVEWQTASEVNTVGFIVWRMGSAGVPAAQINDNPIPAWSVPQGGTYRVHDASADSTATNHYAIEEIEANGARRMYGPFTVNPPNEFDPETALPAIEPRRAIATQRPARTTGTTPTSDRLTATIHREGVYEISAETLAAHFGLPTDAAQALLARDEIEIRHGGQRTPAFTSSSGIRFYAPANCDPFAAGEAYVIQRGRNLRISAEPPSTAATLASDFAETITVESNRIAALSAVSYPNEDYWVWEKLVAGDEETDRKPFELPVVGLADPTRPATLSVDLLGGNETEISPNHRIRATLNGVTLGTISWDGRMRLSASWRVPSGALHEGTNVVEVQATKVTDDSFSIVYVDRIRLSYRRLFEMDGRLFFTADGSAVSIAGADTASACVLDVSDPYRPALVRWTADGANLALPATQEGHRYLAFDNRDVATAQVDAVPRSAWLASPTNNFDYVVVAGPGLESAAATLAAYRQSRGLRAAVIPLSAINDTFGAGLSGPSVVQRFLEYAHTFWAAAPRYIALAGDGTYDYQNQLGYNDSLLPPALISTPNGLFASDAPYADMNADGSPDAAIARLPARSGDELRVMIDKIIAYEAGEGTWTNEAFLLADDSDADDDFESESADAAAALTSRFSVTRCDLSTSGPDAARTASINAINRGVAVFNYAGHGALDRLAQEGIVQSSDAGGLTNGVRMPLLITMTCLVGRYSVPGYPCLGEELLRAADGGVIAVISPVGLTSGALSTPLNQKLATRLGAGATRLGDLWLSASADYLAATGDSEGLQIYNVIGDPALELK